MPATYLHEPDRRVDVLIDYLDGHGDPDLAAWAVEALAGGLGVDVVVVEGDDHVSRVHGLAEALGEAVALAHDVGGAHYDELVNAALAGFLAALYRE